MKPILSQLRQEKILEQITARGGAKVSELSQLLKVSEMTVRRDLDCLAGQGHLVRTHGGALRVDISREPTFAEKETLHAEDKRRIAQAALTLANGEVLGLSAGTTTTFLAELLPRDRSNLTVVTNAVNIAYLLAGTQVNLVLTGGTMRSMSYALVGPRAQASVDQLWLDILFMGANGVHPHGGVTTPNLEEAEFNARLLSRAKKTVLLADHTKLGQAAFGRIAGLEAVDLLITSCGADPEILAELKSRGLKIQIV